MADPKENLHQATPQEDREGQAISARLQPAAAELFWRKGYSATTTRELASSLGVRKASLYYHMERKEDLLYEICVSSLQHIHHLATEAIGAHTDPLAKLIGLIHAHVTAMLEDRSKHATMLTELKMLSADRRVAVIKQRDAYEALVREVLSECQASGQVRKDVSVDLLGLTLLDMMNWAIFWYQPGGELNPEQLADTFVQIFVFGSVSPEGGSDWRHKVAARQ